MILVPCFGSFRVCSAVDRIAIAFATPRMDGLLASLEGWLVGGGGGGRGIGVRVFVVLVMVLVVEGRGTASHVLSVLIRGTAAVDHRSDMTTVLLLIVWSSLPLVGWPLG